MSEWKHIICAACLHRRWPHLDEGYDATLDLEAPPAKCCQCGKTTNDWAPITLDPSTVRCKGDHGTAMEGAA